MSGEKLKPFFITALLAAVGSIIIGLLLFHQRIFDIGRGVFQFLSFGIIGSAVFSGFRFLKRWVAILIVLLLVILSEILLMSAGRALLWQDVLYYAGLCGALGVFSDYYFPKLTDAVLNRLLVLSSLLAMSYVVVTVIIYLVYQSIPSMPQVSLSQMIYYDLSQGFLIGLGIGGGIEVAELFIRKLASGPE
ncbi:MAG: hypothetical protein M1469_00915 [Bacteroidetes bacterium]|nr:hypothetical protein [Bacteroidota bacterium]MCL5266649.1 hypothetical protein [Bacteroidota bacterium]